MGLGGLRGALFPTFWGGKDFWEEVGDGKVEWVRNSSMLRRWRMDQWTNSGGLKFLQKCWEIVCRVLGYYYFFLVKERNGKSMIHLQQQRKANPTRSLFFLSLRPSLGACMSPPQCPIRPHVISPLRGPFVPRETITKRTLPTFLLRTKKGKK